MTLIIVRSGKGDTYREIPVHPELRPDLALRIGDERPHWKGAQTCKALLLNQKGARLGARGADDILNAIADEAHIDDEFTSHVLRHSSGTRLIREGHDVVAELMGHKRLDQTRRYSLPTQADKKRPGCASHGMFRRSAPAGSGTFRRSAKRLRNVNRDCTGSERSARSAAEAPILSERYAARRPGPRACGPVFCNSLSARACWDRPEQAPAAPGHWQSRTSLHRG